MDDKAKAEFLSRIEADLEHTIATIASLKIASAAVAPDNALGRLTRMETMSDQQMSMAKLAQAQQRMVNLQALRRKINAPNFGICRICQKPMDPERLLTVPDAVACAACLNRLQAKAPRRR